MIRLVPVVLLTTLATAQAEPLPYIKNGQCAGGYVQSGNYCTPKTDRSAPAIPKVGQCPSGYASGATSCTRINSR
jgi:hypothetical protein